MDLSIEGKRALVRRVFNDPVEKTLIVFIAPGHGRVTVFEGAEYDAIPEFTNEVIIQKLEQLFS